MPLIDLREHFRLWQRCGNTSWWKELGEPPYRHTFVNPIDGMMIMAQDLMDKFQDPKGLAMNVYVHDASELGHEDFAPSFASNYPWVKKVMMDFFTGLTIVKIGLTRETPLTFFLKYYEDQTEHYKETGEGYKQTGKDELLEATKRLIGGLEGKAMKVKKVILKDDLDEFLEGYGILEC
jgi:hypothetical protein